MTPNTDSVAVLRELLDEYPAPNFTAERAALTAAIATLEAQGEAFCYAMEYPHAMPTIAYINAPEFVKRLTRAEQLRDECEREFGEPAKITPLYLHPAPPGSDAVTEERLQELAGMHADVSVDSHGRTSWDFDSHGLRAFAAALAARTGKGDSDGR